MSSFTLSSPIPLPDQAVFENAVFSDKRSASKVRPPSPPSKSPPFSRVYKTPYSTNSSHKPQTNNSLPISNTPHLTTREQLLCKFFLIVFLFLNSAQSKHQIQ